MSAPRAFLSSIHCTCTYIWCARLGVKARLHDDWLCVSGFYIRHKIHNTHASLRLLFLAILTVSKQARCAVGSNAAAFVVVVDDVDNDGPHVRQFHAMKCVYINI